MTTSVIIQQMIIIFFLLLSGFLLAKKELIRPSISKDISTIVIYLCSPALMITSALTADRGISTHLLLFSALMTIVFYLFLIVTAEIIIRVIRAKVADCNPFRLMHIFSNVGFIGIPVVNAVIGSEGVLFAVIINIGYNVFFYSYGYYRMKQQSAPGEKIKLPLKELINIGMISSIVSLIIYIANIRLPYILSETCTYMGNSTTFLSLFVIGVNLSQSRLREVFGNPQMYIYVFFKQVLTPILFALLIHPFVKHEVLYLVTIIIMAMPVGSMPLMLAEKEGLDSTLFSHGVIVSTILSVITIPIVLILI